MNKVGETKEGIIIAAHASYFSIDFTRPTINDFRCLRPSSLHTIDEQIVSASWSRDKFKSWESFLRFAGIISENVKRPVYQHTPDNNGLFLHKDSSRDFEVYELDKVTDETTEMVKNITPPYLKEDLTATVLRRYVCERESALLVARLKDEQATMIGFCALKIVTDFPDKRLVRANPYIGNDYREHKIGEQLLGAIGQWATVHGVSNMVTSLPTTKLPILS